MSRRAYDNLHQRFRRAERHADTCARRTYQRAEPRRPSFVHIWLFIHIGQIDRNRQQFRFISAAFREAIFNLRQNLFRLTFGIERLVVGRQAADICSTVINRRLAEDFTGIEWFHNRCSHSCRFLA